MTISKNNYKEFEQLIKDENLDIFEIGKIEVNKSSRCTISWKNYKLLFSYREEVPI